jgi:DNA/RNA endonuclease G (NUC1)
MRTKGIARFLLACLGLAGSAVATAQGVRISEFHYDNFGQDGTEAIEIAGPAGTNLTGWRVVLYNGANGLLYDNDALSGTIPATCGTRGVVVLNYPPDGIQNGSPDGMALVDASGTVVEFLSYEGAFMAGDGPANGLLSVDILRFENGQDAARRSLARAPNGTWNAAAPNSFGVCNDQDTTSTPDVVSVSIAPQSATLDIGASQTLAATGLDAGGQPVVGAAFTWTSSAPQIATVNAAGLVTGVASGDAIITATAASGAFGTAAIHVNAGGPPPSSSPVRFNEIHYDNAGVDTGEAIEVEGPAGTDLTGYSIVLYNGNMGVTYGDVVPLSGILTESCGTRGVAFVTFPQDGLQNGSPDGIALFDNAGGLIEFRSYEGTFAASNGPAAGVTSVDIGAEEATSTPVGLSLQRNSSGAWISAMATFGACNAEEPTNTENSVILSGRTPSDVPLPVGFQDQLFARLVDFQNQTIPSTFVWTSDTPTVASIEQNGVFTALSAGSAILRATAADGTTRSITLPTHVAEAGTTAQYGGNTEFGEPADADSSDDYLVRYPQYTASYNPNRGTPNWVAYDLDATHFGTEDRCDCFTMDPMLPANFPQLTTADYTDAGAFHGYGIDRGHMVRSFDRTTGSLDNAYTYLFDNIVPQTADLNQGPWARFENFLGDEARFNGREVYIITGVAGNKGTLKDQGRVVIPTSTWKVAVLLPRDQGLNSIRDYRDLEVMAVNMPNEPGVREVDWQTYLTTVDAIETLTGYDLLALLPDDVEGAVESNTQPPLAAVVGPAALNEGDTGTFSAASSIDPNGSIASVEWNFGDGASASGSSASHAFAQDGVYVVTVTVTDNDGLSDTASLSVTVSNVAPALGDFDDISLEAGGAYTVEGTFSDPGADSWIATVNWGDGSSPSQAMLSGQNFSLVHVYATAGVFTVTVTVADDDTSTSTDHTVTVTQPPAPGPDLSQAHALIEQLVVNRKISRDFGNLMKSQVSAAQSYISQGKNGQAISVLKVVLLEVDLLVQFRQITAADAAPLRNLITQVIAQLSTLPAGVQKYPGYKLFKAHNSCKSHQRPRSSGHQSLRIHRLR